MSTTTKPRMAAGQGSAPQTEPQPAAESNGSGRRTLVNLLLFVHLFTLAALLVFNGSATTLQTKFRRVPGYYLQLLGMDFDFDSGQRFPATPLVTTTAGEALRHLKEAEKAENPQVRTGNLTAAKQHLETLNNTETAEARLTRRGLYHLSHADALDVGHVFEFRYEDAAGEHMIRLPENMRLGQRRIRYQLLAREAARLAIAEDRQGDLASSVAGYLMRQAGVDAAEMAVRRRLIQEPLHVTESEFAQQEPWRKDPWHENWLSTVYERTAKLLDSGKAIFIAPSEDALAAPVPVEKEPPGQPKPD